MCSASKLYSRTCVYILYSYAVYSINLHAPNDTDAIEDIDDVADVD